jgi:hypothetical protein
MRRETILKAKSALLRAMVGVLSLAVLLSGMAHAGGLRSGEQNGPPLALAASHDVASADSPCDDNTSHEFNEGCPHSAGCSFGIHVQLNVSYEPPHHGETVRPITEIWHGTSAAPPMRPPKLSVQA